MVESINSLNSVGSNTKAQEYQPILVDQNLFSSLNETSKSDANQRTSKASMRKVNSEISNQANINEVKELTLTPATIQPALLHSDIRENFSLKKDVAQYKGSDYSNVVHVERGISLDEAFEIAQNNPDIDYFVYVKGYSMVLEIPSDVKFDPANDPFNLVTKSDYIYDSGAFGSGYCRIFYHGDVVFFKNDGMWLGSAPGLADVYVKETNAAE